MKRKQIQRSGLFLAEILISILLFAAASAVCVQVFVQAHKLSASAEEIEAAGEQCSSLAELLESVDSTEKFYALLEATYGIPAEYGEEIILSYNENYELADDNYVEYTLKADFSEENGLAKLGMQFVRMDDETVVYSLSAEHYFPKEVVSVEVQ